MAEDLSASGFQDKNTFESVSSHFSQVEVLGTHGHNVLVRAKRYGRWYLLKGLASENSNDEMYREMLAKEFDILMRLQHSGIVQAIGIEEVEPLGECIVIEWVEGVTLKKWLESKTTRDERLHAASQLIDAIAYIHSNGIAHRDIKPSNIMITSNGKNVKIIDFGLADTDVHAILKQPAGTVQYMAPEQASTSKPDVRNDIYSLGMVMREMNLGKYYKAPIAQCLMTIDERYQSIEELKNDLQRRASRRHTAAIGLAALGLAGALALTAFLAIYFSHEDPSKVYVTDNQARQQVDSLRTALGQTSEKMFQSLLSQDSLRNHLGSLNDTIKQLNATNSRLRSAELEREARQRMIDDAIAEGISRADQAIARTGLRHHLDTVSDRNYVWLDHEGLSRAGREETKLYVAKLQGKFDNKELAEIEYAILNHCQQWEQEVFRRVNKLGRHNYRF